MADKLYIANAALDLCAQGQIVSLDDPTVAARRCALHIDQAIKTVLEGGQWKSARGQAVLTQVTAAPTYGWSYRYTLPVDYIRMSTFNDVPVNWYPKPVYDILGRELHTDESTASITYVKDLTAAGNDISAASPQLFELFAVALAQKMVWGFEHSKTLRDSLLQEYAIRRRAALSKDSMEVTRPLRNPLTDSAWLGERIASTQG